MLVAAVRLSIPDASPLRNKTPDQAGASPQCPGMILLFTDLGLEGPYVGQMKAILHQVDHRSARGEAPPGEAEDSATLVGWDWPAELARVIYVDRFGNAMTGLRAAALADGAVLTLDGLRLARALTFFDAAPGAALWYENANGLAEIAVNQGRADKMLGLAVGSAVTIT